MNKLNLLKVLTKYIFISVLTSFLTWRITICIQKFLDSPTYTTSRFEKQENTTFPAITICPAETLGYKKDKLKYYGIDSHNYGRGKSSCSSKNITWSSNNTATTSEEDLFDEVTYQFEELVEKISIGHFRGSAANYDINDSNQYEELQKNIQEQRHYRYGKCYTFHPGEKMRQNGIEKIVIKLNTNWNWTAKVFLHKKNHFLDLPSGVGHLVHTNERRRNKVNVQEIRLLPKILDDGSISCSSENQDACIYEAMKRQMLNITQTGCTTPWIVNSTHICKNIDDLRKTCQIAIKQDKNDFTNDCKLPCNSLGIIFGDADVPWYELKKVNLELYFPPRVLLTEEKILYTLENLIAEIGGLIGLVRNMFWIVMLLLGYLLNICSSFPSNLNKNH